MALPNALILWPIRFSAPSYNLVVNAIGGDETLPFPASGALDTSKDYYMADDGQADDLVKMLRDCIDAHTGLSSTTATFSGDWKITVGTGTASIKWSDGSTTLDGSIWGFESSTASGTSHTGENRPQGVWRPERPVSVDSRNRRPIRGAVTESISGKIRVANFGAPLKTRDLLFQLLHRQHVLTEYAASDRPYSSFEHGWDNSIGLGRAFRLYEDETNRTPSSFDLLRTRSVDDPLARSDRYSVLWDVALSSAVEIEATGADIFAAYTWSFAYSGPDCTASAWTDAEGDSARTLNLVGGGSAPTLNRSTSPLVVGGIGAARENKGVYRANATSGFTRGSFSWTDAVNWHVRVLLKIGTPVNGDRAFRFLVSGTHYLEMRWNSASAIQFAVRDDAEAALYNPAPTGMPNGGAWALIDWNYLPTGGAGGNSLTQVYVNGTDKAVASHSAVVAAGGTGTMGLLGTDTGASCTDADFLFWGVRFGSTISLSEHQADVNAVGL